MFERKLPDADDKLRVREQILSAFQDVPMPEFDEIIAEPSTGEIAEGKIREQLAGLAWDGLTVDFLKHQWPSFYYLSPLAFQYYLPALLVTALDQDDPDLLSACVSLLTPNAYLTYNEGSDERFDEQVSLFTPDQEMAVVGFLGLFMDADQPDTLGFRAGFAFRFGWDREEWPALQPFADFYRTMHHFEWPQPDEPDVADLVAQIRAAFDEVPYPGDDSLCVVVEQDNDETAIVALEFQGLDWREIHPALIAYNYAALNVFTPDGFRYFLPAYLIADLVDVGIPSGADPVFNLTQGLAEDDDTEVTPPKPDEPTTDWFAQSAGGMAAFSRPEREAIVHYLEYRAQLDADAAAEIEPALDLYWRPSLEA
jgi:hypothetical protein